jgi:PII-like signaling protein
MKTVDVTIVRIYTYERAECVPIIMNYLEKEIKIRGLTVFRALSGFGGTGIRNTSLLDLSFSLPLIIEFFDHPDKVTLALEYLTTVVKCEHLVFFNAKANECDIS